MCWKVVRTYWWSHWFVSMQENLQVANILVQATKMANLTPKDMTDSKDMAGDHMQSRTSIW